MYYVIRLFILLVIGICFSLLQKRKGKPVPVLKRTKKAVILRIAVILLIGLVVFLPYEAPFIQFNSAEASVRYSTLNYNAPIKTVETDKTAFCVGHRDNNFYYNAVAKSDDKYGFCDRHCHTVLGFINTHIDDGKFKGIYSVTKLINEEANEKCYMITFLSIDLKDTEDISIYDELNTPIQKLTFPDKRFVFALAVNQADEKTSFMFNGKTYELD